MTIQDTILTAERIIDRQYDDDLHDYDTIRDYLTDYLGTTPPENTYHWHPLLKDALSADLKDLLSNGYELLDEDEDLQLVADDELREQVCSLLAAQLLGRL